MKSSELDFKWADWEIARVRTSKKVIVERKKF